MAKKKPVKDPAVVGPDGTLILIYVVGAVLATLWLALHLGNLLAVTRQDIPVNPIEIVAGLIRGKLHWPRGATVILLLVIATAIAVVVIRRRLQARRNKGRLGVDDKADVMGNGSAIASLTEAGVREKAKQLGVRLGYDDAPGVPIGIGVADGVMLYGSYEDLHLDIWGPRQGKSTSRVIPAILTAIGPVLATSNKRDVVDATRDVRAAKGSPTFVFDPQGVAGEEASWYWDPLGWVDARHEGCEMRAARLAGHFADGDDGSDAKTDAFFDPEAEDLLAGLFLAAAVGGKPITQVWEWVTNPGNIEPIQLLRDTGHDFTASGLASQYNTDDRTRSGIFGTAKKMVRCLKLTNVHPWVTPGGSRQQFDELDFIERNGTLYSLSLEGRGSASPLVSALTEAVIDIAMRKAARSAGGRLPIPLLAVLDEAANVVRWKDLPKQYSHFGSRGIVVMTVLQSWAQGVRCWGEAGMNALWSAANIKVLGSGVDDTNFLRERSEAIGEHSSISASVSESKGSKSYSRSLGSSKTFTVQALATLPRGRVIVFPSGAPPVLVRTVPWWEGDYAAAVQQSIEQHDPQRKTVITDLIPAPSLSKAVPSAEPGAGSGQIEEVRPLDQQ
ncbi:type IV secretory system conjugative DNA transfer family protein [Nocardia cyriacigeorgica]|uniref:type IV secretory system conjugative DNA transfer family protein n=1 Tax=Nocardia cyriacigeorgica TaxID=135487 RepID=UPI0018946CDB|nr:type IV secretory system conjugative DNA transfer family protein [Nocardia cyriacigeorgica]MBF6435838.1 TraM recognition domain-containing protein [Nocardia cyriacigeorgica]MBF6454083.1 TraM recognition domain-containing protein [Nocardia cyriacigeorgica]MBF6480053.1 TraM recognition domain-containing protein [Nocardia cyriacigeorgica]MBF6551977.1 TraM recognition domain-containing protein [Nocardia cyriacigeorgica]